MSRYNVEYNGKWAQFSTIPETFVTLFMDRKDFEILYKMRNKTDDVSGLISEMTIQEAIFRLSLNKTFEDALIEFKEYGLPENVCEELFHQMLLNYYAPIHIKGRQYKCPNCGTIVEKETPICPKELCELDFFWE